MFSVFAQLLSIFVLSSCLHEVHVGRTISLNNACKKAGRSIADDGASKSSPNAVDMILHTHVPEAISFQLYAKLSEKVLKDSANAKPSYCVVVVSLKVLIASAETS